MFCKSLSSKLCTIHLRLKSGNILRLHERCFSVNFAKALRTSSPFLPEHHQNNASVTVFPISVCTVSISGLHTTIYSEPKKQVVCTL